MFNSFRKFSCAVVSIFCFSFISVSAEAYYYYSNDPKGNMFVKRPYGDLSNCGPLSGLMLTKFADKSKTYDDVFDAIETARVNVQEQDKDSLSYRWWRLSDIKKFLSLNDVKYREVDTRNFQGLGEHKETIVDAVTNGEVVVINIDMNDLKKSSEVGKFYRTTRLFGRWGHFLVIVGYKETNGQLAYEIHDSYSNKGRNRLFYAKDINRAITRYNKKVLIVKRNDEPKQDIFN